MGRHSRVSSAQRVELWRRYRAGETVLEIATALGQRSTSNVYRVLEACGGIAPAPRRRSPRVLSLVEREEISRGVAAGETCRTIAKRLGRAVSTVSQELVRHGGRRAYRAAQADRSAWQCARRPVCSAAASRCNGSLQLNWRKTGRRSRLLPGSRSTIPTIRSGGCHTRPSTVACSYRPAVS
jgi:hypothetical protein